MRWKSTLYFSTQLKEPFRKSGLLNKQTRWPSLSPILSCALQQLTAQVPCTLDRGCSALSSAAVYALLSDKWASSCLLTALSVSAQAPSLTSSFPYLPTRRHLSRSGSHFSPLLRLTALNYLIRSQTLAPASLLSFKPKTGSMC